MRRLVLLCLAAAFIGLSGCAYRLGPSNGESAGRRSIQVNPFENKTLEPRLIDAVSFALRRQLQQDGTYTVDTKNEGDIVLSGTIVSYERRSLSLQSRDALTPRDYRLTITTQVTARDRVSGKLLLDKKLVGHSDIRIGADLASAERQALPLIAADLARNATALLVDGTW